MKCNPCDNKMPVMRHMITVSKRVRTQTSTGALTISTSTHLSTQAEVIPLTPTQLQQASQQTGQLFFKITVPYSNTAMEITSDMTLTIPSMLGTKVVEINGPPANVDGQYRYVRIQAVYRENSGT